MKSNMKKTFYTLLQSICDRLGVSHKELLVSTACIAIGGMYLFYTFLIISVCH